MKLNRSNKSKITAMFCGLLVSANAMAIEYFQNGNLEASLSGTYTVQDCNGTIKTSTAYGFIGKGAEFVRDGNVSNTCANLGWNNRVELYAYPLPDITQGTSRWSAFSFRVTDDEALGNKGSTTIQQWWSSRGIGPKIQFYVGKNNGVLSLNLLHTIRCTYPQASQFINSEGEYLCDPAKTEFNSKTGEEFRKVRFESYPISKNQWYHVRMGIAADAPQANDLVANGDIRAAVRPAGGTWKAFSYFGANGRQNYFKTFTHEVSEDLTTWYGNHFKFGWYGSAAAGTKGVIQFDELYSNSYYSALPAQYLD
ncbi:hypothetical protein SG34_030195 [Thalassomonas viridans]|uniref:Polysaccharide lyase-like protein n=1 Tax=Thalassomonas viridans TaxID=137584 RepID=A0AAE9Z9J7_9GAMM|nr:heparin lyase I family protein [Thalassomonas viridans]WDE09048.1 hypothetical protein SG34_030195 [Thalassomonas viridans]